MSSDMNPSVPPLGDSATSTSTMAAFSQDAPSAASSYLRAMNTEVDISKSSSNYRQDFGAALDLELSPSLSRPFDDASTAYMLGCLLRIAQSGIDLQFQETGSFSSSTWDMIKKDLGRIQEVCQDMFESIMHAYHDIRKLAKYTAMGWIDGFEVDTATGAIWTTKERDASWGELGVHAVEVLRPLTRLEQYNYPNPTFKWWKECKALADLMPSIDVSQYTLDQQFDDSDSDSVASQDTLSALGPSSPMIINRRASVPFSEQGPFEVGRIGGDSSFQSKSAQSLTTAGGSSRRRSHVQPVYGWEPVRNYLGTVANTDARSGEWHCPVVTCARYLRGTEVPFTTRSSMKRHWMSYHAKDLKMGRLRDAGNGTCVEVVDVDDEAEEYDEEEHEE